MACVSLSYHKSFWSTPVYDTQLINWNSHFDAPCVVVFCVRRSRRVVQFKHLCYCNQGVTGSLPINI